MQDAWMSVEVTQHEQKRATTGAKTSPEAMPKVGPRFPHGGCSGMLGARLDSPRGDHPLCSFHSIITSKSPTILTKDYRCKNLRLVNNDYWSIMERMLYPDQVLFVLLLFNAM